MEIMKYTFTYPIIDTSTLFDISVHSLLSSRVRSINFTRKETKHVTNNFCIEDVTPFMKMSLRYNTLD